MRAPDYRFPLRDIEDVPIHRPVLGGMGVAMGSQMPAKVDKCYVYRGTGEDQFLETPPIPTLTPAPTPKPKPKPKPKRRPKPKAKHVWCRYFVPGLLLDEDGFPKDPMKRRDVAWMSSPDVQAVVKIGRSGSRRSARPAPGWQPMTGAEIDDLLEEFDA